MKDKHSLVIQSAVLSADELFDVLSDTLASKLDGSPVIASDLARLLVCRHALEQGYDTVIWCDADFLIFHPATLTVPEQAYGVGREVWVDIVKGRPKAFVKVHNAFMYFRVGNPFLDFYAHAAECILVRHDGPTVTQLVGLKLLTALHNINSCRSSSRRPCSLRSSVLTCAPAQGVLGHWSCSGRSRVRRLPRRTCAGRLPVRGLAATMT
ncbi:MAG: hypothetical protein CMO26_14420 [Thiotrichales bacterium]|nr:hypothetical protein [Thiotrichales bacterium]